MLQAQCKGYLFAYEATGEQSYFKDALHCLEIARRIYEGGK